MRFPALPFSVSVILFFIFAPYSGGSPATPLQQAAQQCFKFLADIVHGIPPSRLSGWFHGESSRNSARRHHGHMSPELDVANASIYCSADLSLIRVPTTAITDAERNDNSLWKWSFLHTSPIAVSETVWIRGAEAFGEVSKFDTMPPGSLSRSVDSTDSALCGTVLKRCQSGYGPYRCIVSTCPSLVLAIH